VADVPMPVDLTEEAVAEWLHDIAAGSNPGMQIALRARAVLALVRDRMHAALVEWMREGFAPDADAIVARVMGEEAPRG